MRFLKIVVGTLVIAFQLLDSRKPFGFVSPQSALAIGYDLSIVFFCAFAIWLIYQGIQPKRPDRHTHS